MRALPILPHPVMVYMRSLSCRATHAKKQGCGSETINFRSGSGYGSYLEGYFGSGSCPQVFSDPDPDLCLRSFREIFTIKVGM